MAQILFFGASSTYGVGGENGGTPDLIKAALHKQAYGPSGAGGEIGHEVYNLGIPGATSALLLERIKEELKPRTKNNRQLITLVSIGTNDSHDIDSNRTHAIDSATYRQNLVNIFAELKGAGAYVITYGFTPVDESKTSPIINPASGHSKYFINDRIREFEKFFMRVAEDNGAQAVPLFEQAIQESWGRNYLYPDGLHPNTAGHVWIAEKIRPKLWELLNIK